MLLATRITRSTVLDSLFPAESARGELESEVLIAVCGRSSHCIGVYSRRIRRYAVVWTDIFSLFSCSLIDTTGRRRWCSSAKRFCAIQERNRLQLAKEKQSSVSVWWLTISKSSHLQIYYLVLKREVHDFYKTSWFVEFEVLSRMVNVRGSYDKPFKRYSRLKNLLCECPQGTTLWHHWAIEKLSKCADSSHFTFFYFVLIVMHLHFGVALDILAGE